MNGDLILIDFNEGEVSSKQAEVTESKSAEVESRAAKIKRLAAQIESGEYELPADKLAENLLDELLGDLDFE